jgi:hypothetical protein
MALALMVGSMAVAVLDAPADPVGALDVDIHETVTEQALHFLRPEVLRDVRDEHGGWADDDEAEDVEWVHFDSCAFGESAQQINAFYKDAIANLTPGSDFDSWSATDDFGRVFHPAQDFYAHSNWVELGFPRGNLATSADLIDFSTRLAGASQLGEWQVPSPLRRVRDDILLADLVVTPLGDVDHKGALDVVDDNRDGVVNDRDAEIVSIPDHWSVGLLPHPTQPGAAGFVPGVDVTGDARFRSIPTVGLPVPVLTTGRDWRFLITAVGGRPVKNVFGNQCDPYKRDANGDTIVPHALNTCPADFPDDYSCIADGGSRFALTHSGSSRSELNKDNEDEAPTRFPKARALALLQSKYEWCRLVHQAGRSGVAGLLLALWVREGASPNPLRTPCGPDGVDGPVGVIVSIDEVTVFNDKDNNDDEPGEVNLSLVLYDSPFSFHRAQKSKSGPVFVDDDGSTASRRIPRTRLPPPVTMCIRTGGSSPFRVALHGWDDDEGPDSGAESLANGDFNAVGGPLGFPFNSTPDDAIVGFSRTHLAADIPIGSSLIEQATSADLQVSYRLRRVPDVDGDGIDACGEAFVD